MLHPLQAKQYITLSAISSKETKKTPPLLNASRVSCFVSYCEGVGTLLSSIIPECKEVTKEDEIGRNEDDETISRKS
jgi:hypothetical protein